MAAFKQTRIALFRRTFVFLLTSCEVNLAFSSSCTGDCQPVPVESNSTTFSSTNTATSAKVTTDEVTSTVDSHSMDTSPTTRVAKTDPSAVQTGTTTTSLKNLSPAVTDRPKPEPESPIAVIGLVAAVISVVLFIVFIVLTVILVKGFRSPFNRNGDARGLPMSNIGFQPDETSTSKTKQDGE